MQPNPVKRALRAGQPAVGTWLSLGSITAARFMARTGFAWLTVDIEHSLVDWETATHMFAAITDAGCTALASSRNASCVAPARCLLVAASSSRRARRLGFGVGAADRSGNAPAAASPPRARARTADFSSSSATSSSGPATACARCQARRSGSKMGSVAAARARCEHYRDRQSAGAVCSASIRKDPGSYGCGSADFNSKKNGL